MKREANLFDRVVGIALTLMLLMSLAPAALAKGKEEKKKQKEPTAKQKAELKSVYKKWLDEDVLYIITDDERKAFKALKTDEERDQFIEQFWLRRDPDPDTPENEYKDQYYERIQYANEHYTSGVAGWRTDRGRIYITFGKADEIESHPSGGSYDRPSWEGGGSTTTYPFETWWYRYIEGIGSDIEIEFVDPSGSGEYRIARSPDEKDALLNVPGAGLTLAEQLGMSNKADRIGGLGDPNSFQRQQDSPFARLQLQADLMRAPQIKYTDLAGISNTPIVEENPLDFDLRV